MRLSRRLCIAICLATLCACARTEPPVSHLAAPSGDAYTCEVEIRAETSLAGHRDVYRLVSTTRYSAEPGGRIRVLARDARAYRGDDGAAPFASAGGASSPVGAAGASGPTGDDERATELSTDGHHLYVAALERRSRRAAEFPLRLVTPDGRSRDVVLGKATGASVSWSGNGADTSAGDGAKPAAANAPAIHLPAEVVDGVRAISIAVTDDAATARARLVIDFGWAALGDAAARYELRVGPADDAR